MIDTTARNATLMDLSAILRQQHAAKVDVVLPATALRARDGMLHVDTDEVVMDDAGVTPVRGAYRPTVVCDERVASALSIPVGYLKRTRNDRPYLWDANVNGWIHGRTITRGDDVTTYPADDRSFLLRAYRSDQPGEPGVARALLSNRFKIIDNLDVLTAGLEGVRQSGVATEVVACNLSERSMRIRFAAPGLRAMAPALLAGYRSPFDQPHRDDVRRAGNGGDLAFWRGVAEREGLGHTPGSEPVVFAGFDLSNDETGGGAFSITPVLLVQVCRNGLTINALAQRQVHLGGRLTDGVIAWSAETQEKALELVTSKATDTVRAFLTPEFLAGQVAQIEAKAGAPITAPEKQIQVIGRQLGFSEDRTNDVLAHFIMGGSLTAGGVLNAITSLAQTLPDPDDAAELEATGMRALDVAAALART